MDLSGSPLLEHKLAALRKLLVGYGRVAIGFSGGVDSTLLLKVAVDQLGPQSVLALLADTPSMPRSEIEGACRLAASIGSLFRVVQSRELDDPVYISNPVDRCYYCKRIIFGSLLAAARELDFSCVLDGNNADDADDYRPGHKAAVEMGVRSPLMEAALTKAEIRALSRQMALPTADKPALACLATRVACGQPITRELLRKIETAEQVLWDAGFSQVRVRDHGGVARLEIADGDFAKLADRELRQRISDGVRAAGYEQVLLDLRALERK